MSETKNEPLYGVRLKKQNRFLYQGRLYRLGEEYAVPRRLRDYLYATGFFEDCLIDEPEPTPIPAAAATVADSGAEEAPIPVAAAPTKSGGDMTTEDLQQGGAKAPAFKKTFKRKSNQSATV